MLAPKPDVPSTLDELLDILSPGSDSSEFVWRGQAYFLWTPYPTLIRRMKNSGMSEDQITEVALSEVEFKIIEDAWSQQLLSGKAEILEFMCKLQHYGGATRLLDVTHNPLVAAFFASSPHGGDAGVIYRYRIDPENIIDAEKTSPEWFDVLYSVELGHPLLIKPKKWDKRIEVQDGAFVTATIAQDLTHPGFYTNQTRDSEVEIIWITPKLKSQVRRYLEGEGINEVRLFPSIEQFARNHRVSDPIFLTGLLFGGSLGR